MNIKQNGSTGISLLGSNRAKSFEFQGNMEYSQQIHTTKKTAGIIPETRRNLQETRSFRTKKDQPTISKPLFPLFSFGALNAGKNTKAKLNGPCTEAHGL